MIGVNLESAAFGSGSHYGYDYIYPGATELDYYHSKGLDLIRLPFTWERMQPDLGGSLNPDELARMEAFIDAAAERGMQVVIDLHNYGRYDGQAIGTSAVPISAFADFWSQLATALHGRAGLAGYDIMNEPNSMGGTNVWPAAAQAAVDAIRAVDMHTTIYMEGDAWSGAQSWLQNNSNFHINDVANRLVYEAHVYFDHDNSGIYAGSYDQEQAYPNIGVDRLQPFLDWLHANNAQGFVGEFSVPDTDPRWLTVLDNFLSALQANGLSGTYWGGGPWWGDYPMSIAPQDGQDAAQMAVLENYTYDAASTHVGTDNADTLVGARANEHFIAGAGNDVIEGAGGADLIDGQSGNDTASYAHSPGAVDVDLTRTVQIGGDAAGDRLVSIENLTGSSYADTLRGDGGVNWITGGAGDDTVEGGGGADVLGGNGGIDTVSYAHSGAGVVVDIGAGTRPQSGGDAQGDVLYSFENVTGSAYDDVLSGTASTNVLLGGAGNDVLEGRGGADILDGGAGIDTASYAGSSAAVNVDLTRSTQLGGDAAGDQLIGIENVTGSALNDTLVGDQGANTLSGGAGNDTLIGGGGADDLIGGAGIDTVSYAYSLGAVDIDLTRAYQLGADAQGDRLVSIENVIGSAFNDVLVGEGSRNVLTGGAGDDVLRGGGGGDVIDGGLGIDTASYAGAAAGVIVDLTVAQQQGGDAAGDVLVSIENVIGTDFADSLRGDGGANLLIGNDGADTLDGRGGADTLDGGLGIDTVTYAGSGAGVDVDLTRATQIGGDAAGDRLVSIENLTGSSYADTLRGDGGVNWITGGAGDDTVEGGGGADVLGGNGGIDTVSYAHSGAGVIVDIGAGTSPQSGGDAQGDVLYSFENVTGSAYDDVLSGTASSNVLLGGAGNDLLEGRGGADILDGGAGIDTASYAGSSAAVNVDLTRSTQLGGDAAGDQLIGIENVTGSAFNDTLVGDQGANTLSGGAGSDRLVGGGGADYLIGGAGNDTFVFSSVTDIGGVAASAHDVVADFAAGDRLDFSAIDATAGSPANDAFTFIGSSGFTGHEGELRVQVDTTASQTYVEGDLNGDSVADFHLVLLGPHPLAATDFIL